MSPPTVNYHDLLSGCQVRGGGLDELCIRAQCCDYYSILVRRPGFDSGRSRVNYSLVDAAPRPRQPAWGPGSHHEGIELKAVALPSGAVMRGAVDILRVGEAQDAVRMAGGVEIEQLAQADLLVPARVELGRRAGAAADAADPHRAHRRMALEHAHAHHGQVVRPVIDRRVNLLKSQGMMHNQK